MRLRDRRHLRHPRDHHRQPERAARPVPGAPAGGGQAKLDWYADGDISLNANIGDSAEAAAAEKVVAFTATPAFGNAFSAVAGEISPIKGSKVPAKYPLAVQDEQWYQTQAIQPIFGIRSPMDTPPPDVAALKANKSPGATDGVWTDEQNLAVQLLQGKLTPAQMAAKVQGELGWYYGTGASAAASPSSTDNGSAGQRPAPRAAAVQAQWGRLHGRSAVAGALRALCPGVPAVENPGLRCPSSSGGRFRHAATPHPWRLLAGGIGRRTSERGRYEAPFMFLLSGNERALLLDTGAVADPEHGHGDHTRR